MSDVVLIPCYNRPEFLYHCLERIKKADGAEKLTYLFKLDFGYSRDCEKIIDKFPFNKIVSRTPKKSITLAKQSYNVLTGYKEAAELADNYVFMVEDDIMIATDFFSFHYAAQEKKSFCSIAVKNPNRRIEASDDLREYYVTHLDYCSLGVCFDKKILKEFVLPHANDFYFRSPQNYVTTTFPLSSIGKSFAEQDGLIRRIQEHQELPIIFPHVPRAYHSGFYSYHRGKMFYGELAFKIKYVGNIIFSDEEMRKVNKNEAFYEDSKPVQLDNQKFNYKLKYKQI